MANPDRPRVTPQCGRCDKTILNFYTDPDTAQIHLELHHDAYHRGETLLGQLIPEGVQFQMAKQAFTQAEQVNRLPQASLKETKLHLQQQLDKASPEQISMATLILLKFMYADRERLQQQHRIDTNTIRSLELRIKGLQSVLDTEGIPRPIISTENPTQTQQAISADDDTVLFAIAYASAMLNPQEKKTFFDDHPPEDILDLRPRNEVVIFQDPKSTLRRTQHRI